MLSRASVFTGTQCVLSFIDYFSSFCKKLFSRTPISEKYAQMSYPVLYIFVSIFRKIQCIFCNNEILVSTLVLTFP
jgi:hypothetical protein